VNWLQNHVQDFVVPTIKTLAKRDGLITFDRDVKPFDGKIRPSQNCRYPEVGLVYATCASVLRKSDPIREVALGLCRKVGEPGDNAFVYELDSQNRVRDLGHHYEDVNGADVLHSFLCNSVRALKQEVQDKDARVIYPGRDVWAFEVMSKRVGLPSVYDSRISREIDGNEDVYEPIVKAWDVPNWEKALAFDSGYAGTVPRAIGRAAGVENINVLMMSAKDSKLQLFSGHTGSRAKALALEYLAKYRKRCLVKGGEPHQPFADLEEFIKSALLTIWLWHHKSPRRLPSWQAAIRCKKRLRKRGNLQFASRGSMAFPLAATPTTLTASVTGTGGLLFNNAATSTSTFASNWQVVTTNTTGSTIDPNSFGVFGTTTGGFI
jgi:hypothetical protein